MSLSFSSPRRGLAAAVAILLATSGCNLVSGDGGGEAGTATAQAPDVTPESLRAAVNDEQVKRFYEARQWQSAWSNESAEQLKGALQGAVRHGLDPRGFLQEIESAQSPVEREVALSRAAVTYAEALGRGRTDPSKLFEVYTLPRNEVDVPAGLAQAVAQGNAPQWIEGLAPQDEEYKALSQAYMQHLQATQQAQGGQQAAGQPRGGQQGQAGNQQAAQQKGSQGKEKAKEKDKQTKSEEAVPGDARDRAVVLAVNMERRRWLPRNPEATRIDVNTAATFLKYIRDNQVADQRVVVVGEPGWETPQLGSPIYRLVANPDWTVPESIESDELANLSPGELRRKNMERKDGMLVQQPGPENALGRVKFDMRNEHAIYLHDTPAKSLFQRDQRHLSHGCIRVNDALGFARMLAESHGKLDEFNQALEKRADGHPEKAFIDLGQEIPVRLLYHTAFLDGGQLRFNADPYGWDAKVAEALGLPVPPASERNEQSAERKRERREGDFGP